MNMLFTTNTSDELVKLAQSGQANVDGFEIGEYLPIEKLRAYRQALPGWKFYFHGRFVQHVCFAEYLPLTDNTFTSLHLHPIDLWRIDLAFHFGIHMPFLNPRAEIDRYVERIRQVKSTLGMPLILENLELVRNARYRFGAEPEVIAEVLERTACDLLLDIGHARVASAYRGIDVRDYIKRLPLGRVTQVHISGPRPKGNYLYDAHETLQDEDYALLEWTLERTHPQMLTLEYHQDVRAWQEQVGRIRKLLAGSI